MGRSTRMNNITSPELLAQVNPKNIELMNDYLEYLKSIQRSETTRNGYKSDLEIAWVWCLQNNDNLFFVNWTKRQIAKFQNWCINENGNSSARVRRLKAVLSSLSNFIEDILDDEYPNFRNIINRIENPPNQPVREKTVVSGDDIEDMLKKLVELKKYKTACCVALMAYGGRRKAEICRFKVSDFGDDKLVCGGSLWKSDPIKTKGRGNGKYLNCYTLAHKFRPYLELWMNERSEKGIESEWLFPDNTDPTKQMTIATINSYMKTLSRITGLPVYAHMFRHRYTTMLSEEGIPDSVIKEIQGWASLELVYVYIDRSTEDALEMYFDENGIKTRESKGLSDL